MHRQGPKVPPHVRIARGCLSQSPRKATRYGSGTHRVSGRRDADPEAACAGFALILVREGAASAVERAGTVRILGSRDRTRTYNLPVNRRPVLAGSARPLKLSSPLHLHKCLSGAYTGILAAVPPCVGECFSVLFPCWSSSRHVLCWSCVALADAGLMLARPGPRSPDPACCNYLADSRKGRRRARHRR